MKNKLTKDNTDLAGKRKKRIAGNKAPFSPSRGDSGNTILMQIEEELNKNHFNLNNTNDKIKRYAEQIVLMTEAVYAKKLECFTMQRLAHTLGLSREYMHQLAKKDFEYSPVLAKALEGFRLAIADNLTTGGVTKQYSEGFSRHLLSMYDSHAMEHEKALAMLKQLEGNTQPIQVILNKPNVTGKHQASCGDVEQDGGF